MAQSAATRDDPVCGMAVELASPTHRTTHEGDQYVFCSSHCLTRFEAAPEAYVGYLSADEVDAPLPDREARGHGAEAGDTSADAARNKEASESPTAHRHQAGSVGIVAVESAANARTIEPDTVAAHAHPARDDADAAGQNRFESVSAGDAATGTHGHRTRERVDAAQSLGGTPDTAVTSSRTVGVTGMHCAACVRTIEQTLAAVPGVARAEVSLATEQALLHFEGAGGVAVTDDVLRAAVEARGYGLREGDAQNAAAAHDALTASRSAQYERLMRRFWVAAAVSTLVLVDMVLQFAPGMPDLGHDAERGFWAVQGLGALLVMSWSGRHFFAGAWKSLKHHNADMNTLIAIGTGTAWIYSTVAVVAPAAFPEPELAKPYYDVVVIVIALVLLGNAMELRAKGKTSAALRKLLDLQAKTAIVVLEGEEIEVPIERVAVDDLVLVRPGEKVPVDGEVEDGRSTVDASMVTGEPIPVDIGPGSAVIGGTINKTGAFRFRATHVGSDTALARIVNLVQRAQGTKPPIGRLVDVISGLFVPIVLMVATMSFLVWYNVGPEPSLTYAIIAAVTVLVIACPCALGLATPMSIMAGVGKAAEHGVLIRDGEALQAAATLDVMVLDKTGTITKGAPELTDVIALAGLDENELLRLVASAERGSEHPLAESIVAGARQRDLELVDASSFEAIPGHGIRATVDGRTLLLGNARLMEGEGVDAETLEAQMDALADSGRTPMLVAVDGVAAGIVAVADPVKDDSVAAIAALHGLGLEVVMLTGDNRRTAEAIAAQVGIGRVLAEVLPEDKSETVGRLQEEGRRVGMVGDGINDAPALARAHVGFAMGTGTDVAIESAGITLMSGSLRAAVAAIETSRATMRNIKQNLGGAFAYNTAGIPLAAGLLYPLFGLLLSPMIAGAAMAFSSVTVVTNANRLRRFQPQHVPRHRGEA